MDLTIAICTHGDVTWRDLAFERAAPSAMEQPGVIVQTFHREHGNLANARNVALDACNTEWIVYLDADDELEPGFVDALREHEHAASLLAPAVRYVQPTGRHRAARMPRVAGHQHDCTTACLRDGNWMVVGTAARTALLRAAGGWRDWPMYEDWDLWLRCVTQQHASVIAVPEAVYRAHVRRTSRNRAPSMAAKNQTHHAIVADVLGVPA